MMFRGRLTIVDARGRAFVFQGEDDGRAITLRAWRARFAASRRQAVELYGEPFARMWEFYLAASESAFRVSDHVLFQIQFARRKDALPGVRDYITEWERRPARGSAAA